MARLHVSGWPRNAEVTEEDIETWLGKFSPSKIEIKYKEKGGKKDAVFAFVEIPDVKEDAVLLAAGKNQIGGKIGSEEFFISVRQDYRHTSPKKDGGSAGHNEHGHTAHGGGHAEHKEDSHGHGDAHKGAGHGKSTEAKSAEHKKPQQEPEYEVIWAPGNLSDPDGFMTHSARLVKDGKAVPDVPFQVQLGSVGEFRLPGSADIQTGNVFYSNAGPHGGLSIQIKLNQMSSCVITALGYGVSYRTILPKTI